MKGYMYILKCADGSYYTGSTTNIELRLRQHQNGEGANYTKKRLPVELVYFEEYERIDHAFYREKQVQGWSRKKKEALINNKFDELKKYAECMNESHYKNAPFGSVQKDTSGFSQQASRAEPREALHNKVISTPLNHLDVHNHFIEFSQIAKEDQGTEQSQVAKRSRSNLTSNTKQKEPL